MDKIWNSVPEEGLNRVASGEKKSESDISASFRTLWDDKNIYFFIQVNDNVKSDDGSSSYDQDGIELYIDCDNSKSQYYGNDEFQLRYNWNENEIQILNIEDKKIKSCAQSNTTTGYDAEVAIPWDALSHRPKTDQFVG